MKFNSPVRFFDTFPKDAAVALAGGASGGLTLGGLVKGVFSANRMSFLEKALAAIAIVTGPGIGYMASDFIKPTCYSSRLRQYLDDPSNWRQVEAGVIGIEYMSVADCLRSAKEYFLESSMVREVSLKEEIKSRHHEIYEEAVYLSEQKLTTPVLEMYLKLGGIETIRKVLQDSQDRLYNPKIDDLKRGHFERYFAASNFCKERRDDLNYARVTNVAEEDIELLHAVRNEGNDNLRDLLKERISQQ
jgi:hypothetical protein